MKDEFKFTKLKKFTMWFNRTTGIVRLKYFLLYDMPNFVRNVWLFRKSLTQFHWYNLDSTLMFMKESLDHSIPLYESRGNEVPESRELKIEKMKRLQYLLYCRFEYNYIDLAEEELGKLPTNPFRFEKLDDGSDRYVMKSNLTEEEQDHETKVYDRASEIEKQQWDEIIEIIKGKVIINFKRDFDGTGIRNWWN
jgi:hypothetical protein